MASAKNILQEYFQKRQLSLPIYNTYQSGSINIRWNSTVTLDDGRSASGSASSKVAAEQLAAQEALNLLSRSKHRNIRTVTNESSRSRNSNIFPISQEIPQLGQQIQKIKVTEQSDDIIIFDEPTALLVDLENLPKIVDELPLTIGLDIYVFVGEHHSLVDKVFNRPVIRIVSPSTRKDGTDTCMQVYTGMLLTQQKYEEYLVATIDHYGAALIEMIENNTLGWVAKRGRLITRSKQLNISQDNKSV